MERMGPRCAGDENGDGATAGRTTGAVRIGAVRIGAVRATAVTAAVVAALAGCSVTVQPKNAAAARPLTSSTPTPSAASSAPSTTASSSQSPTPAPSDVDHTACTNVREALATLRDKLESDKESASRTAQDYRTAGYSLRSQSTKTKNSDLKSALRTIASDYLTVGYDAANRYSTEADLGKTLDASKSLATLCGGGSSSSGSSTTGGSSSSATSSSSSSN